MKIPEHSETSLIQGVVAEGIGESGHFTRIFWVKEQFVSRLGIDPYPGTFNVEVRDSLNLERLRGIRLLKGIEIVPAEPGFCPAKGFPVLINGEVKGALIIPQVPQYPEEKMEIIAVQNIRNALFLKNGDPVTLEVFTI